MYADHATFRRPNQETTVAETHRKNGGTIRGSFDEGACSYILHNGAISAPFNSQEKLQLQHLSKLYLSQHWNNLYPARNDFRSPLFLQFLSKKPHSLRATAATQSPSTKETSRKPTTMQPSSLSPSPTPSLLPLPFPPAFKSFEVIEWSYPRRILLQTRTPTHVSGWCPGLKKCSPRIR